MKQNTKTKVNTGNCKIKPFPLQWEKRTKKRERELKSQRPIKPLLFFRKIILAEMISLS